MKTCPYCGGEYPDDATVCPADRNALVPRVAQAIAMPISEPPIQPTADAIRCPACGAIGACKPMIDLRGSFSWWAYLFGGILAVMFQNAGRGKRFRCESCRNVFIVRSTASKVSRIVFWILIAPSLIVLVAYLLYTLFSR